MTLIGMSLLKQAMSAPNPPNSMFKFLLYGGC